MALSDNRNTPKLQGLTPLDFPQKGSTTLYSGALAVLDAGYLAPGRTATGLICVGRVKKKNVNTGSSGAVIAEAEPGIFRWDNTDGITQADVGSLAYVVSDHGVAKDGTGKSIAGIILKVDSIGVWVASGYDNGAQGIALIQAALASYLLSATIESTSNGEGASTVGLEDAGGFTTVDDVEAALAELYQDALSAQAQVNIPLSSFYLVSDGSPLVKFNDGVADGIDFIEGVAYRFNLGSTAAIGATVAMLQDLDDAEDVIVHVLASRVGSSDTTAAITVGAFFQTVGAAYDADSDAGGATGAISGATKVVSEVTCTLAAADVPAAPCALSLSLVPTAALDADDMRVHAVWIEYTRKLRNS